MSSEGNQMNDGTSFQQSEPVLCATGCGFFGSAATNNLCSKCYRDLRVTEEQTETAKKAFEKLITNNNNSKEDVVRVDYSESSSDLAAAGEKFEKEADLSAVEVKKGVAASNTTSNRCFCCKKKVGVLGFACRCGSTFCGVHRYPEKHDCGFDFKRQGKEAIAKANPVVKADKIQRI